MLPLSIFMLFLLDLFIIITVALTISISICINISCICIIQVSMSYVGMEVAFPVSCLHSQANMALHFAIRNYLFETGNMVMLWHEKEIHQKNPPADPIKTNVDQKLINKINHCRNIANALLPLKHTAEQVKEL